MTIPHALVPILALLAALSVADRAEDPKAFTEKLQQYLWASLGCLEDVCGDDRAVTSTRWALLSSLAHARGDQDRFDACVRLATLGPDAVRREMEPDADV